MKAYLKRGKNDAADAAAICEAFRGHAAEFGIIGAQGRWNVAPLLTTIREDQTVPEPARTIRQCHPLVLVLYDH